MRSCIFAGVSDSQRCSGRSLGVSAREALVGIWERGRRIYGRCCLDEKQQCGDEDAETEGRDVVKGWMK